MRNLMLFPAAIVAMSLISFPAFAGGEADPIRDDLPCSGDGCAVPAPKPRPAAPKPAPAPAPEPVPVVEVTPVPEPAPQQVIIEREVPAPEPKRSGGLLHLGAFAGGSAGLWPVRAQVIDARPHMGLPAAEGLLGIYALIDESQKGTPYIGVHGALGMGSIDSRLYSGGIDAGGHISDRVGMGGQLDFFVRDLDYRSGEWAARYVAGAVGPQLLYRIDDPAQGGGFDAYFVGGVALGAGSFIHENVMMPTVTGTVALRVGLGTSSSK